MFLFHLLPCNVIRRTELQSCQQSDKCAYRKMWLKLGSKMAAHRSACILGALDGAKNRPIILSSYPTDISNVIKKLPNKKSPDVDKISNRALKTLPLMYIKFISTITTISSQSDGGLPSLYSFLRIILTGRNQRTFGPSHSSLPHLYSSWARH